MQVTVIVPTFNEAPNITALVDRIIRATRQHETQILFVDDSTDDTPAVISRVAETAEIPVRLLHRDDPVGGLSGAVCAGFAESSTEWCVVMDGDLQHPPEMIPVLLETAQKSNADVAVASRYCRGGSNDGLSGWGRRLVSGGSIALTRAMFPNRLRNCTDPMTGFFALRREAIDLDTLQPRGFKILLEILARHRMRVVEEPFIFAERVAGQSKADLAQGVRFVSQLAALRFGRLSRFGVIGAIGAVANILIMAALVAMGVNYVAAAIAAAGITIFGNFFAQERFVFRDLRAEGKGFWTRFATSVGFNVAEAILRLPVLAVLVETAHVPSVVAQGLTLAVAFVARFVFHSRVVYRPARTTAVSPLLSSAPLPSESSAPTALQGEEQERAA
jgi:dolichol-phosphate mannosyltransferase